MKILLLLIAAFAFAFPAVLAVIWVRKTGAKKRAVLVGALTFFIFAQILEGVLHVACLLTDNAVSRFLNSNVIAYGIYGALAAGVFEETGRFAAFKTLLRRCDGRETAVAYGIGHGGFEMIILLGVNYLLYIAAAFFMESFSGGELDALVPTVQSLLASPAMCLVGALERVIAMILHISLSVFVFKAARVKGSLHLYPLAVLLHALVDFPAALHQSGIISIAVVECVAAVYALCLAFAAKKIYTGMNIGSEK